MDSLKNRIEDVSNHFNGKTTIVKSTTILNKTQTDDKQATAMEGSIRCFDSLHLNNSDEKLAYQISKESAGMILIINQKQFYFDRNPELHDKLPRRRLETRHGTDRDADILEKVFSNFGYRTRVKHDLTHLEVLKTVQDVVDESIALDSIVICILSHGCKGIVYGSNSIPVEIEAIEKLILADRLIGKPKILIVQACQGEETQRAKKVWI